MKKGFPIGWKMNVLHVIYKGKGDKAEPGIPRES
jgi:hypothetical protein